MKIAICDDNEYELHLVKKLVDEYALSHPSIEIILHCFSTTYKLAEMQISSYDILFLDILMPKINGIEFAKALRNAGVDDTTIVFVTSSKDYALDAYSVDAAQYLLKPISYADLSAVIDRHLFLSNHQRAGNIVVSSQDGIKNLYFHNIIFVECTRHLARFYMSDKTKVCSKTLRMSFATFIEPLLADERFVRTHHSFLLNKEFVVKLNQRDFELVGGHTIPIAKDKLYEVKSSYMNYLDKQKETF